MIRTYLLILSILIITKLELKGQFVFFDSVGFNAPHIVCEKDTLTFIVYPTPDTANGFFIRPEMHIDMPAGYEFDSILYYGPTPIVYPQASATNLYGPPITTNPDDIIIPNGGGFFQPYNEYAIQIIVTPSCGAQAEPFRVWFIGVNGGAHPVSDTLSTPIINIQTPYLVFQGIKNTAAANSTINLNRLAIGQKFERGFKVDYTSLISNINEVTVAIPNTSQHFNYYWTSPGITSTTILDTVYYTFDASYFAAYVGDNDGVFEPGESFIFYDSVSVSGNCNSQNTNVAVDYALTWGCGGNLCQYSIVSAEGRIALSPTDVILQRRTDLEIEPNLCDTCGTGTVKYGFQIINNTQPVLPTGGFLTNVRLDLGISLFPYTIASNRRLDSTNHCFDSVIVNGINVPFRIGSAAPVIIDNLTIPGTGLIDIDGDGLFDDLPVGDTLVVELYGTFFAYSHDTSDLNYNNLGGSDNINPSLVTAMRGALDIEYYDECGGNFKERRILGKDQYLNPLNANSTMPPDVYDGGIYRFNIQHREYNTKNNYECDSAIRLIKMILPWDVSLDTSGVYPFSGYRQSTDSVIAFVEVPDANPARGFDTLYIYYNTKGVNSGASYKNTWVNLRMDCNLTAGFCPEADSSRTIAWTEEYICYDDATNMPCWSSAMHRGKRLIRYHCSAFPPTGVSLKKFKMKRTTFGYTDSTKTVRVNATTPGINLNSAMVEDTIKITMKGLVVNSTVDSIFARLNYQNRLGVGSASRSILRMDPINSRVTVYDASTTTYYPFSLGVPLNIPALENPERYTGLDDIYDWQWNLSAYDDSVRLIDPAYNFNGGPNNNSTTWDSIIMEVYLIVDPDNYAGEVFMEPVAQMIEIPTDTATICDQYGQLFTLYQPSISLLPTIANSLTSCETARNTIEVRTTSQDRYPNEYKRNEKVDTVIYTYNPSYFYAPDSVFFEYRWYDTNGQLIPGGDRRIPMNYTVVGDSIIIPIEESINMNVLPEAWYRAYLRFYQKPTCEIEDSVLSSVLGQVADLKISRWTNSSIDTSRVIIDNTFGTSNTGPRPIVVDPVPFNITSSPIVSSTESDSVCWDITYENLSFTEIGHTWLDFDTDSLNITSIVRIDSGASSPFSILNYGINNKWIQMDTIKPYDFITARVCATYTTCNLDSIIVTGGWNCSSFPVDPVQGYDPTSYTCNHNQQSFTIFMDELDANLQLRMFNQPIMPMDLCDSMVFEIEMGNIDLTSLNNLYFKAFMPTTSNIAIRNGTSSILWPNDGFNTTRIPIADPITSGDSIVWDLTGEFSAGFLENFEIPLDSNKALIRFVFDTRCFVRPTDQIRFKAEGERGCNKIVSSQNVASSPIRINGLVNPSVRLTKVNIDLDTINACDTGTVVHLAFYNIVTKNTNGSEVLSLQFPADFDIKDSIYNVHLPSYLQGQTPTNTVVGNTRTLEWNVASGMPFASPLIDSLSFDLTLISSTNLSCNLDTMMYFTAEERYEILCVSDSTPCTVIYPLAEDSNYIRVAKADLDLANLIPVLDFCNDTLNFTVEISNTGLPIAQGILTPIYVLADSNNNGIYDSTDVVFDTIFYTDSLPTNWTDTIRYSEPVTLYNGELCNLILLVDTASCICDTAWTIAPVELEMYLDTHVICEYDSVPFTVCTGTGNFPSRTFTWYDIDGLGNETYLSSTTILNPTFIPPNITTSTTYRYAVQVQRDSCMNEDTLIIIVHPQPDTIDIPNDTICEGDSVLLTPVPFQLGITYNLYDSNYVFIDTLPWMFNDTLSNKFYVESIDSATGCGALWDSVVIIVIPFLDPGIGDSIIHCETGMLINLFDSLQGTPDTNGTWTDPLNSPFGVGHNAVFDPAVHLSGNYTYTIINPVCPDTSAVIHVTASPGTNAGLDSNITLCRRDNPVDLYTLLRNNPDTTGNWSGLSSLANGYWGTFDPSTDLSGRYKYKVDKIGCASDSSYVDVTVNPVEDATIQLDRRELCLALSDPIVSILGDFGGTFTGSNGLVIDPVSGIIDLESSGRGTFEIYYTTNGPCPEMDTIPVVITQYGEGCELWIPQFVSPNGDGANDYWVIPGVDEFPNNNVKIFNRWGNLVFEMNGYDNSWEGKSMNSFNMGGGDTYLPDGTYFYIVNPNDADNDPVSGFVYIRR